MTMTPASRAFFTVGTIAVEVARHQQDALGAGGDELLDGGDFAVVVAVELAGVGLRRHAKFLGLRLEAFAHLDEERIGVGLGDQPDDRAVGERGAAVSASVRAAAAAVVRIALSLDTGLILPGC